jgi:hypothetical protein
MALTDIVYYDGGSADLTMKLNTATYSGSLKDVIDTKFGFVYGLSLVASSGATDYAFGG